MTRLQSWGSSSSDGPLCAMPALLTRMSTPIPRRHELGGSELARAFVDAEQGETLTPVETTAQIIVLLFAGFETTSILLSSGLRELLLHPEQWQRLADAPARAEVAIDELLRWVTPTQWLGRYAIEDIDVAGEMIPAGQTVYPSLAMANRDPAAFAEPETLDLDRENAKLHLSFGLGPHFCLGNNLTRLEASIVFELVARHYPEVTILDEDPPDGSNAMMRAIQHLPTRMGRRRDN